MPNSSRLFFALWPDDETRQALVRLSQSVEAKEFKWVQPHNLHVTLVFLGQVDNDAEALIKQSAAEIAVPSFELAFDKLSYWSKPKILCLTCLPPAPTVDCTNAGGTPPVSGGTEQCRKPAEAAMLASALEAIAQNCGLQTDARPYTPHITLARHARYLPRLKFKPIIWRAEAFCLVESCSEPDGVYYKVIQQWPLLKPTANPDLQLSPGL